MNIEKAQWNTDGNNVRITMPLQKVDQERRIVSGWATLDNIDTSDDKVVASASKEAFASFRGNIRLMHQPIPAGKLVDFREDSYYDPKTEKFYNGIYVDVYVSKGAPQVWDMVLDGTLTGFSIGGKVTEIENQFDKAANKPVRLIKKYELIELSLVDSPANQLCDVVSIQKAADGTTSATGMVTDVVAENVFWCGNDKIAFTSQDEAKDCTACGGATDNIGWFESDGGDKTEKVNAIVADFTKADTVEGRVNNMAEDITNAEGVETEVQEEPTPLVTNDEAAAGEDVEALGPDTDAERVAAQEDAEDRAEELDADDAEVTEDDVVKAAEALEEAIEEVVKEIDADIAELEGDVEKAAQADDEDADGDDDSDEEGDDDNDVKKADDAEDEEDEDTVAKAIESLEARLTKALDTIAALEAVANKVDEIGRAQTELAEKFAAVGATVDTVKKSYDAVEKTVGLKKSGDLGGSKEDAVVEKSATTSKWGGRFFGSVGNI